jgi:hypothetical protein
MRDLAVRRAFLARPAKELHKLGRIMPRISNLEPLARSLGKSIIQIIEHAPQQLLPRTSTILIWPNRTTFPPFGRPCPFSMPQSTSPARRVFPAVAAGHCFGSSPELLHRVHEGNVLGQARLPPYASSLPSQSAPGLISAKNDPACTNATASAKRAMFSRYRRISAAIACVASVSSAANSAITASRRCRSFCSNSCLAVAVRSQPIAMYLTPYRPPLRDRSLGGREVSF